MLKDREIIYDVPEKKGISVDDLKKLLHQRQHKLQMDDWKIDLKIVDFKRSNGYRQSGDFIADLEKKTASILMAWNPWRGDEEYTLVHELLHILVYDYDKFNEDSLLKNHKPFDYEHGIYMDKLENLVDHLTVAFLGREELLNKKTA